MKPLFRSLGVLVFAAVAACGGGQKGSNADGAAGEGGAGAGGSGGTGGTAGGTADAAVVDSAPGDDRGASVEVASDLRPDLRAPADVATAGASTPVNLNDVFADTVRDATRWVPGVLSRFNDMSLHDPDVIVAETGKVLEIRPLINQNGLHYGGYVSAESHDFLGWWACVKLVSAPNTSTTAEALYSLGPDGNNLYRFDVQAGQININVRKNGTTQTLISVPYNAVQQRYLRIRSRKSDHHVVWETSPDTATWTTVTTASPDVDLSKAFLELAAGTYGPVVAPGTVQFDELFTGPSED